MIVNGLSVSALLRFVPPGMVSCGPGREAPASPPACFESCREAAVVPPALSHGSPAWPAKRMATYWLTSSIYGNHHPGIRIPRRQELLSKVRIPFKAFPPNIPEQLDPSADIPAQVMQFAQRKIETVVTLFKQESPRWVLGLDTLVELDGAPIPKPSTIEEAEKILPAALRTGAPGVHRASASCPAAARSWTCAASPPR